VGGSILLGTALVALLPPLSEAGVWGWGDRRTIGLLAAAAVLFTVFVAVERRLASPVVNVRVNARPALLLTNVASLAVGFALFATLPGTTSYVQAPPAYGYGLGSSILVSSMCLLPSGVSMLIFSLLSPKISARYGPKVTLALAAFTVSLGGVALPSLTAYRVLFAICAGSAALGAAVALVIPTHERR
jgi:Na+/melibiose symporter-like transporter